MAEAEARVAKAKASLAQAQALSGLTEEEAIQAQTAAKQAVLVAEEALAKARADADTGPSATEEQAQATIETANQAAKALEELGPKIRANEDEWRGWSDKATAYLQAVADKIRDMPMPPVLSPSASASAIAAPRPDTGGGGTAVINIDGRQVAEAVVPRIPGVVKRYGLA